MSRTARVARTTKERDVLVVLVADGTDQADISTVVIFVDHMLYEVSRHGGLYVTVLPKCNPDGEGHT